MANQNKKTFIRLPNGDIIKVPKNVLSAVKNTNMDVMALCSLCSKNYVGKDEVYCLQCQNDIKSQKQSAVEQTSIVNHYHIRDDFDRAMHEDPFHMFKFTKRDFDKPVYFLLAAVFGCTLVGFIFHLVAVRHVAFDNSDIGFIVSLLGMLVLAIFMKFNRY